MINPRSVIDAVILIGVLMCGLVIVDLIDKYL